MQIKRTFYIAQGGLFLAWVYLKFLIPSTVHLFRPQIPRCCRSLKCVKEPTTLYSSEIGSKDKCTKYTIFREDVMKIRNNFHQVGSISIFTSTHIQMNNYTAKANQNILFKAYHWCVFAMQWSGDLKLGKILKWETNCILGAIGGKSKKEKKKKPKYGTRKYSLNFSYTISNKWTHALSVSVPISSRTTFEW